MDWESNIWNMIRVEKTASRGIVVEKVYMYLEPDLTPATGTIADDQVQAEIEKLAAAKNAVVEELGQLAEKNEILRHIWKLRTTLCFRRR